MISVQQIKAARALLNWKQSDLAESSGISLPAIAKLEAGDGNPRQTTLHALKLAFENAGIDFLGRHGVDQRQEAFSLEVLHGKKGMQKMWNDIEKIFADGHGGEVLLGNLDERLFLKHFNKEIKYVLERRSDLNIITRGLISEKDSFLVMPIEWYRAIPELLFSSQIPYFIYADRMGIVDLKETPRIILIQNKSLANAFRQQFEFNWSIGKKVDPKKAMLWKL
jgi:transcriptional regulator with XRE-family HTH domain